MIILLGINKILCYSIPESKQHMVLPEIEEEDEDLNQRHSKLSLTSLLLGKITKNVFS